MIDNGEVRVYVNERGVSLIATARAIDAVRALFPEQADEIDAGRARVTDSRGLPIAADTPLHGGAIFRVLPVRERLEAVE